MVLLDRQRIGVSRDDQQSRICFRFIVHRLAVTRHHRFKAFCAMRSHCGSCLDYVLVDVDRIRLARRITCGKGLDVFGSFRRHFLFLPCFV